MLQAIRDRAQGVIAWIIILIIIVPFALWGINQYIRDDSVLLAAQVDDVPVPLSAYQRAFQNERNLRQRLVGNRIDLLDNEAIKKAAIERLINAVALAKAAQDAGYRIGDEQLADRIRGMREFQDNGHFDVARYASLLNSLGLNQAQFEADLRQDMLSEQVVSGLTESEFVSSPELGRYVAVMDQTRDFDLLELPAADFRKGIQITDAEIERAYEASPKRFMTPERVRVDYIELSVAALKKDVVGPDEETLHREYEQRKADYGLPEERRASHILLSVPQDATDAEVEKVRARALELKQRIDAGEPFEKLAREFSEDPGSAKKGGDLGYFARGIMDKPFEDKVFSMAKGQVSDPVRSRFGFHIIRLEDIRKGAVKPFEEVRDSLRQAYIENQAEERFYDLADRLTDLAYENPDSLEPVADALGLEIRTSGYFSRDAGQEIASDERIRTAAFSDDVLEKGENSEPIELDPQRIVVLRVHDRQPAERKPLSEVHDVIEQELLRERLRSHATERGKQLIEALQQGQAPDTVAKETGHTWRGLAGIRRDAGDLDAIVLQAVFTIPRPADKETSYRSVSLDDGGLVLIALKAVKDGSLDALSEDKRKQRQQALLALYSNSDSRALIEGVKTRLKIKIFEQNL